MIISRHLKPSIFSLPVASDGVYNQVPDGFLRDYITKTGKNNQINQDATEPLHSLFYIAVMHLKMYSGAPERGAGIRL